MEQIKKTALLTAACRARFNTSPPWKGKALYMDRGAEKIVKDLSEFDHILAQFPPGSEEVFGIRFHWQIQKLVAHLKILKTKAQVVILGAGMDLSYLTLAESDEWTKITGYFEVDLPATQSYKKQIAGQLNTDVKITYVACNFNEESFIEKLKDQGWDTDIPTIFLWMGVSYYLEEKAVIRSMKSATQAHKTSCFIMDYASPMESEKQVKSSEDALKNIDEPILFKCHDISSVAAVSGYQRVEQTTFLTELLNHGGKISEVSDKRLLKFSVLYLS